MDKAAIYCRLSKEDYDKINSGDDSASIQNQKALLVDYAMEHDMAIYKVYSDDDYSGADKQRPAWNRMLKDAENEEFNTIICKTQSRFTREMEIVEKYIHGLFIEWGIRFIGVVDNVDTNVKGNKKNRQINGLVNEWYLEDTSENIRSVFRKKMKDGQFIGAFACYGYKKDPDNKYKIIIDEEAASTVRLIFELSSRGYGVDIISQKLTEMKIPTPTIYKQLQGLAFRNPNSEAYTQFGIWSTTTIKRILNNEAYIGTLIQGREKKLSYKSKKVVIAPRDEWIVIKNNHKPIISEELFNKTQQLLKLRRKTCKSTSGKKFTPHLFSGRIKCLDCNGTMAKTSGRLAGGHDYFICQKAKKSKLVECTRHSIRYDDLVDFVIDAIKEEMRLCIANQEKYIESKLKMSDPAKTISSLKTKLKKCQDKIQDIKETITEMYIDKVKHILSETDFVSIKATLQLDLDALHEEESQLNKEIEITESKASNVNQFVNYLKIYLDFKELTIEMVNNLIVCIRIGEKPEDETKIRDIIVEWNF